jgi:hypothetical protein
LDTVTTITEDTSGLVKMINEKVDEQSQVSNFQLKRFTRGEAGHKRGEKQKISKTPAFGEIRAGWYEIENKWFLTWDALQKEFKLSAKNLAKITATTSKGGIN